MNRTLVARALVRTLVARALIVRTFVVFALVGSFAASGAHARAASPVLRVAPTALSPSGSTTVTVTGRDYLVPPHEDGTDVFGGVYLFFGWVADGKWGPSARNSTDNRGTFGETYAYPGDGGDPSTRGDAGGTMRFISFTSGGESGESTDYHMDDDGNWSAPLLIRGPVFRTTVPGEEPKTYDCRELRCGVFTIGAHGKSSATNERFTPVTFASAAPPAPSVAPAPIATPTPTPTADPPSPTPRVTPSPTPRVTTSPPSPVGASPSSSTVPAAAAGVAAVAALAGAIALQRRARQ